MNLGNFFLFISNYNYIVLKYCLEWCPWDQIFICKPRYFTIYIINSGSQSPWQSFSIIILNVGTIIPIYRWETYGRGRQSTLSTTTQWWNQISGVLVQHGIHQAKQRETIFPALSVNNIMSYKTRNKFCCPLHCNIPSLASCCNTTEVEGAIHVYIIWWSIFISLGTTGKLM